MNILERIGQGSGILTEKERAALEDYADSTGFPEKIWQVYDDTDITDEDYLGTKKAGPQHLTEEAAVEWANRQPDIKLFSIYIETRRCTRKREIWYQQGASYSYSSW